MDHAITAWMPADPAWRDAGLHVQVARMDGQGDRRAALRTLAASALAVPADAVEVAHETGQPPRLVTPSGRLLHLSSSSRDGWAALAVAGMPVGIDLETTAPGYEIPDLVLHPDEILALRPLRGIDQARAFARLWSIKEAYLKALGKGLARDPGSFAVRFVDEGTAEISDPVIPGQARRAETRWLPGRVVSLVLLA